MILFFLQFELDFVLGSKALWHIARNDFIKEKNFFKMKDYFFYYLAHNSQEDNFYSAISALK